ncbi:MAG: hypothetical protein IKA06_04060 [Clostridia bacterium]|nr:hypothetical protein [Clostridia bacterium]
MEAIEKSELTPRELCRALGVNIGTLARWKRKGCPYRENAPYTIGRQASRPRYNLEQVKAWIQEQQKKGDEA